MRRTLLSFVFAMLSCQAADLARNSPEFRKDFIEKFPRTGLNTTPGDALMLRILIEARGAKRAASSSKLRRSRQPGSFTCAFRWL